MVRGTMDLKSSRTFQNILNTINGELKASTKYSIYSGKAKDEGYQQIGNIFQETSGNEKEHAEEFMKVILGGSIPDTYTNLKDAVKGENGEWSGIYKEYADTAREEGFEHIADLFDDVASVEKHHEYRFDSLAENIANNKVFCKGEKVLWICLNCGFLYWGECAPEICPLCGKPQAYFQLNCENY